jgi:hypothetical protein
MKSARLLAAVGVVLAPSLVAAQESNPFTDSWFWGAKGGIAFLHTSVNQTEAPTFGAEWLITRSKFAFYLSVDQSYFDAISSVDNAPSNGIVRLVDIRDMRRVTGSVYMFPKSFAGGAIRPYAGIGYAFNFIVRANSQGNQFASPEARDTVLTRIETARTRTSLVGTLGTQLQVGRLAPFVQATVMPTRGAREFLINGQGFSYYVEGGLRWNFGNAIEQIR